MAKTNHRTNAPTHSAPSIAPDLQPALVGLLFATLTLLFGFGFGIVFGLNEDAIKSRLSASAVAVSESVYQDNTEAIDAVLAKSWTYMKRTHLHSGGLGATAIGLILVTVLLGTTPRRTRWIAIGLGAGSLGYSVFWLWAGWRAPALGSTGAAKESLKWLAMPSSGAVVLATLAVFVLILMAIAKPAHTQAHRRTGGR